MEIETTPIPGVLVLRPRVFRDEPGSFWETWRAERYAAAGLPATFAQDNVSVSHRGVLHGLHAQRAPYEQGKLVGVMQGVCTTWPWTSGPTRRRSSSGMRSSSMASAARSCTSRLARISHHTIA
jgi:hypothetical protein